MKNQEIFKIPTCNFDIVVDTDAYADSIYEMDDQFAIAYMLTYSCFNVKAFYTFTNDPEFKRGIIEVVNRCHRQDLADKVFAGGTRAFDRGNVEKSEAAVDLIERSKGYSKENPLYVLAIGPVTNIASALSLEPSIAEKIVVVALFGHDFNQKDTAEYNLQKDLEASKVLMESDAPLMLVPCIDVAKKLELSSQECVKAFKGKNEIGDYLIYCMSKMCSKEYFPKLKRVIWDAIPVALLSRPELLTYEIREKPLIDDNVCWKLTGSHKKMLYVSDIDAEKIKKDMLERISEI